MHGVNKVMLEIQYVVTLFSNLTRKGEITQRKYREKQGVFVSKMNGNHDWNSDTTVNQDFHDQYTQILQCQQQFLSRNTQIVLYIMIIPHCVHCLIVNFSTYNNKKLLFVRQSISRKFFNNNYIVQLFKFPNN